MKVELGAKVRDVITGYAGVAIGHVTYISGCNQVLIHPGLDKDGKLQVPEWIDEQRLHQVGADVIQLDNGATPGCDRPAPKRA